MASDVQRRELEEKVSALVAARFGGDYRAAFAHYDADRDGAISAAELKTLLADAGVGSGWTRWAWAAGVMAELDANRDRTITWAEFAAAFEGGGQPTGRPDPSVLLDSSVNTGHADEGLGLEDERTQGD